MFHAPGPRLLAESLGSSRAVTGCLCRLLRAPAAPPRRPAATSAAAAPARGPGVPSSTQVQRTTEAYPTQRMAQAPPPVRLVLVAAATLLNADRQVLLAQRLAGKDLAGLWEFPGGKVEPGETPEAALARELQEELGIEVDAATLTPLTFASHTYSKPDGASFHLLMPVFVCTSWKGDPVGAEGQALAWAGVQDLENYAMPPADLPLLPAIKAAMQGLLS